MSANQISIGYLTDLCKGGDINFRFSSRSSAAEGIRGHQAVQRSRAGLYMPEYPVSIDLIGHVESTTISGRIDGVGFDLERNILFLDEIKTLRVDVEEIPPDVMDGYWRQAMLYGHLLAENFSAANLLIRICLYHLDAKTETILERIVDARELHQHFVDVLLVCKDEQARRRDWRAIRNLSVASLGFPYKQFRAGQRDMAVAVYKAVVQGEQLVMQAPTGIGKTMGTMFPAIQGLATERSSRIFYLSARSSTQSLARQAVSDLEESGGRIRAVTITAKDKVCLTPGAPCAPEHCSYASGYYDRVRDAIEDAFSSQDQFDKQDIEDVAVRHQVCPFELSLDLSNYCDVIIGDYNYVFDPVVHLRRFFDTSKADSIALVDEAHNLVDRGRDMFSASVQKADYLALAKSSESGQVTRQAKAVNRAILDYRKQAGELEDEFNTIVDTELPEKVIRSMQRFCESAEETLRDESGATASGWKAELLQCYFDTLRFVRTAENFADDYRVLLTGSKSRVRLKLQCIDPSRQLAEGFERLDAAICFSATMQPREYFSQLLGVDQDADWYRIPSPFPVSNLSVAAATQIDTSWKGRRDSEEALVDLIYRIAVSKTGNYIVFFPSYEYMDRIHEKFVELHSDIAVEAQRRDLGEDEREAFLGRFNDSPVCGFAVMGGIFSEGIDLQGTKLIGAIVVGVGLPQISSERNLIRDRFQQRGFEYAYQYPGMVKVLQTAGRVIRSESDRGIVCLVDRRYGHSGYRKLLPEHWNVQEHTNTDRLIQAFESFWHRTPGEPETDMSNS